MWVNEAMADLYGFTAGKIVAIPIAGKPTAFTVAGVWRDYARPQGAVVIERERYVTSLATEWRPTALRLAPGTDLDQVSRAIARGSGAQSWTSPHPAKFATSRRRSSTARRGHLRARARCGGDRLARIVVVFRRTLLARRREFACWHIGMTRQVGVRSPAGLAVSGIGLAVGLGWARPSVSSSFMSSTGNRSIGAWASRFRGRRSPRPRSACARFRRLLPGRAGVGR